MSCLTIDQILAASDMEVERVTVQEWGGEICLRTLMGWERDKLNQEAQGENVLLHFRAKVVARSLCDESGKSMGVTDEQMIALSNKSGKVLDRLFELCCKLSGIGPKDEETVGANEKNGQGQSENSGAS
jgi:hypothetical protein